MLWVWATIRWIHLLSAIAWIGGQLFIVLVLLPIMRAALPPDERTLLFAKVGERFAVVSWVALALLVVTGFLNGERRGIVWGELLDSSYGQRLAIKLGLVAVVIVITLVHALYFGQRLTTLAERARSSTTVDEAATRERRGLQRASILLSSVNLLLNLVIVLLAASLVA
ncbi:MAG TPA: DUF4149 domain-containing protein [Thermomicrobiaceae bacterium]|nr:DUF4149 domain-containing protein [Thermomicrobiaceae bacterium]